MTIYAALNTFTAVPGDSIGTVISLHRTEAGAARACRLAQPTERGGYLPTTVVVLSHRVAKGRHVSRVEALLAY